MLHGVSEAGRRCRQRSDFGSGADRKPVRPAAADHCDLSATIHAASSLATRPPACGVAERQVRCLRSLFSLAMQSILSHYPTKRYAQSGRQNGARLDFALPPPARPRTPFWQADLEPPEKAGLTLRPPERKPLSYNNLRKTPRMVVCWHGLCNSGTDGDFAAVPYRKKSSRRALAPVDPK